jgi:hypothetical protein
MTVDQSYMFRVPVVSPDGTLVMVPVTVAVRLQSDSVEAVRAMSGPVEEAIKKTRDPLLSGREER